MGYGAFDCGMRTRLEVSGETCDCRFSITESHFCDPEGPPPPPPPPPLPVSPPAYPPAYPPTPAP